MLKVYVMPDGIKRQYDEKEAPNGAVPYEPPKQEAKKDKANTKKGK